MLSSSRNADFVERTRNAIAGELAHGHPAISDVAAAIGTSVRTLQRRLTGAGIAYRRIVDEVRLETALRLFEDRLLTLTAISSALGYSDPAHFTKAFTRWTGMTPRAYRRRGMQQTLVHEIGGHDAHGSRCRRDGTR